MRKTGEVKKPSRSIENLLSDETEHLMKVKLGHFLSRHLMKNVNLQGKQMKIQIAKMENLKSSSQPRGRDASPEAKDHHPTRTKINLCNL